MIQTQQVLQNRYRLLQRLKHTAGRQTWLAEDLVHQPPRNVIIKLLAFADPVNWETLKLFEREAKILRNLDHPRIPRYLDSFSIEDRVLWFGLVHEFIPGTSLKDLLDQGKRFSEKRICQLATELLQILIYLHELNPPVLHRDIKPSNSIWADDGHLYLIDFGTVQDKAAVEGATFTVVGTYGYAPMEQFGGRTVPASDLYALGATLIHLLTGVSPADLPQHNLRIQFANKTSLRPGLVRWIGKMTEPDVDYRFKTARSALESLQWIMQGPENSRASLLLTTQGSDGSMASPPIADILGVLPFAAFPAIYQPSTDPSLEAALEERSITSPPPKEEIADDSSITLPPPKGEIAGALPVPHFRETSQQPGQNRIALQKSPKALVIRITGELSYPPSLVAIVILLIVVSSLLIRGPIAAIAALCMGGLFFWMFMIETATLVVNLTARNFSCYKEMQLFSSMHRWLIEQVPTPAIEDVAHWNLGDLQTETGNVIAIKTGQKTYFLGQAGTTGEKLSRDECIWLAQEIRAWLGLGSNR